MTHEDSELGDLFERLVADPASVGAFEQYARAVEAAARGAPAPELAETLARHLETLPALAESRLEPCLDHVQRGLLESVELEQLRSARALGSALDRARELLQARYPRVGGRSPGEFVQAHRHQPLRILDYLEEAGEEWHQPLLQRARGLTRRVLDVPGDPDLDAALAGALAELGARLGAAHPAAAAEVAFRLALVHDPGQADARAGLGELALRHGRQREAELELRAALDRDARHPRALAGLAELLLECGRGEDAAGIVERLLETHPRRAEGHLLAGSMALWEGRLEAAARALQEACELDPDDSRPFGMLAEAYARAGHPELATRYREAAARRQGPEPPEPAPLPAAEPGAPGLPEELLVAPRPPPPPRPPAELGPTGSLTRGEVFERLLDELLASGPLGPEETGMVLRARGVLRIPRERFLAAYDAARDAAPPEGPGPAFAPERFFEAMRREAWRDGRLSPAERELLGDLLDLLGIERRRSPRKLD